MKVSVISPIYKVSRFIDRCAESLMRQTLQEVEFIFVNDGTPDDSMDVLQSVLDRFPERKEQVKIITHLQNKGLPAARNTGLKAARGEYIFHCDSDDFVEYDMLEKMYSAAAQGDCDIVWADWYLSSSSSERYMKQPYFETAQDALDGILDGQMKYNVWNKLVRRSLYTQNGIEFPDGYGMGEDMTMIRLFCSARKVGYVPQAYYHYVIVNENAFSSTYSPKHLQELRHNVAELESFLRANYKGELEPHLNFFKLEVKFPFLISDCKEKYRLWQEWFPEANAYASKNRKMGRRRRLLQSMAAKGQWWFVRLYYALIYKSGLSAVRKKL